MRKCIECENQVSDDALFCSSCGKAVHSNDNTQQKNNNGSLTHSFPDRNESKEDKINEACATTAAITDIQPIAENSPTNNVITVVYGVVLSVVLFALVFWGSWAKEEWQFREFVGNHNYKSLGAIIANPDTSMSKKERAIEAIVQAGDSNAAIFIEEMLLSDKLKVEVEKIVWETLAKYKLSLPSGMAILAKGKYYGNTAEIQQYYLAVMPIEQEVTSMKQIGSNLAKEDNITALSKFFGNTKDIIKGLPEKEQVVLVQANSSVDAWADSLQKTKEATVIIQTAQEKININNGIINDRLNKMHSLVMAAYKARNIPMSTAYMDDDLKSAYAASFKQTDATVRAMTNDLSGGDPTKRALVYLDIAMRFGDPDINKQVASWGGEISEQAEERAKNNEEYRKIMSDYDTGRLNRNILKVKSEVILLLADSDITADVPAATLQYKTGGIVEVAQINKNPVSFHSDLLGNSEEITVEIPATAAFGNKKEVIVKGKDGVRSFTLTGERGTCYIAYLRDDRRPDIIFVLTGGAGGWLNEFTIIGKTEDGAIGKLAGRELINTNGRTEKPTVTLDGKTLVLNYKVEDLTNYTGPRSNAPRVGYKTNISWNDNEMKYVADTTRL